MWKFKNCTLLLIGCFCHNWLFSEAIPFGNQAGLYNSSDPIVQLSTLDFKRTILATSNAWLVEFYSSWCGHCIDFAPTFKALAKNVKGIGNQVTKTHLNDLLILTLSTCRLGICDKGCCCRLCQRCQRTSLQRVRSHGLPDFKVLPGICRSFPIGCYSYWSQEN